MPFKIPVKKILILVLILAVPGFLYYLLTAKGKNRYKPLQVYGPRVLAKTNHKVHGKVIPDTIFHTIGDFHLTDQDGRPVSLKTFDNKILIVSFFYTRCTSVCNDVNAYIDSLSKSYAKNKLITFVSITVDPGHDTPAVLKAYAQKRHAIPGKWLFLTGDTTSIYQLARNGFLVNALKINNDNFVYSDKLILVDVSRRIRGYYSGTMLTEISRLDDEIKVQIAEELRKKEAPLY